MMCIKQHENPLTMGFCQANKNRNVTPVKDGSWPKFSHRLSPAAFLHFPPWQKLTLTTWKEDSVSSIIQTFQSLILVPKPNTPFMVVVALPACGKTSTQNALKHLCWVISTSRNFSFLWLYFWCNIVKIHLVELFINWIKATEQRSVWATSYHLKHSWHSNLCICAILILRKMPELHRLVADIKGNIREWKNKSGVIREIVSLLLFLNVK